MRRLYLLTAIFIAFTLSSCNSTTHVVSSQPVDSCKTCDQKKPQKVQKKHKKPITCSTRNPISVQVYAKSTELDHPYKILGKETISKFNSSGIKRQDACIHDALRKLAASLGGDAVINITRDERHVTGTIVAFDKKVG
jgi:hypothetical protein